MPSVASRLRFVAIAFFGTAVVACTYNTTVLEPGGDPKGDGPDGGGSDAGGPGTPRNGEDADPPFDGPVEFDTGTLDVTMGSDTAGPDVGPVLGDSGSVGDSGGVMVTWGGGCWYVDSGHKYQAMQFQLVTPQPIPLEATLYFTTTCDPSQGTDNLNDNGSTIGTQGWLFWFIHHPDMPNTSAIWSVGNQYSGCIDYSNAPNCN